MLVRCGTGSCTSNGMRTRAIKAGVRPTSMPPDKDAIYTFCNELLTTKRVGDATYQTVKDRFGERGVVDLIGIVAYLSDGRS